MRLLRAGRRRGLTCTVTGQDPGEAERDEEGGRDLGLGSGQAWGTGRAHGRLYSYKHQRPRCHVRLVIGLGVPMEFQGLGRSPTPRVRQPGFSSSCAVMSRLPGFSKPLFPLWEVGIIKPISWVIPLRFGEMSVKRLCPTQEMSVLLRCRSPKRGPRESEAPCKLRPPIIRPSTQQ